MSRLLSFGGLGAICAVLLYVLVWVIKAPYFGGSLLSGFFRNFWYDHFSTLVIFAAFGFVTGALIHAVFKR